MPIQVYAKRDQTLHEWLKYYYLHRDTRKVITALNYFYSDQIKLNAARKMALTGSFATLFQQHPEQAVNWIKDSDLTAKQRRPLILNLWYAGLSTAALNLANSDGWTQLEIGRISRPAPKILDIPLKHPAQIGLLWGAYRVSGDQRYIARVIRILLDSAEHAETPQQQQIVTIAAQSLFVYQAQHDQVAHQFEQIRLSLSIDEQLNLDLLLGENEVADDVADCD